MDDLGAEHLSEISKIAVEKQVNKFDSSANVSSNIFVEKQRIQDNELRAREGEGMSSSKSFSPSSVSPGDQGNAVAQGDFKGVLRAEAPSVSSSSSTSPASGFGDASDSWCDSDGREKTDATPENVKKIDDVIQLTSSTASRPHNKSNPNDEQTRISVTTEKSAGESRETPKMDVKNSTDQSTNNDLKIVEDESSPSKHCLAFTIDFGDSSARDSSSAAVKYKNMVERFQNRHKRGASLSKLDSDVQSEEVSSSPVVGRRSPRVQSANAATGRQARKPAEEVSSSSEATKVRMRIRDRSTSGVREASKRHSWSPRSSTHEPQQPVKLPVDKPPIKTRVPTVSKLTSPPKAPSPVAPPRRSQQTRFTPRSTAMQMALEKVDFLCPQPPLDDFTKQHTLNDADNVSEAGTYTLDGDNYTEEQKELMNIDNTTAGSQSDVSNPPPARPTDLPIRSHNNVLEVNYYHDSTTYKPKTSYLEKIKTRVRNITKNSHSDKLNSPDDLGTFTSITASGVLAKKPTLDSRPVVRRKNSLSKSQIDSSEYVSSETKLKSNGGYTGGFTDHQKAEYRLNVFTNQTDSQILHAIESPSSPTHSDTTKLSDTAVLKTAQSKNDWIQEWARNARARSVASNSSPSKQQNSMSRSYNCETTTDDVAISLDDSIPYRNKHIDRFRMGDFDYSSDPNVSSTSVLASRPPKSPSKIPSPLTSIGRARSASRTRGSLQNILQSPTGEEGDTEMYLQKTATAISNLAQSLSRKNSLKSASSSISSPKKQHYSADEYSPQHYHNQSQNLHKNVHKRNFSLEYRTSNSNTNLMTNSLNEHLIDLKIPRNVRKNSFDLHEQTLTVSPVRRHQQSHQQSNNNHHIDQTRESIKQSTGSQQSPLRRSSSFSVKPQVTSTTPGQRPRNLHNLYTPPTTRHQYGRQSAQNGGKSTLKKSASSNSFRKIYSDYDDHVAYYINDEDDLVDEYYTSEEEEYGISGGEDYEDHQQMESSVSSEVPLSNTRYNKALLMRIERSKQKVAGVKPAPGGVVACPNTPELPRRKVQSAPRGSIRQSMPRDTSMTRLKGEIPNSLASAKKQILQTANADVSSSTKRVQPKYLDISKYKPAQGANFLRKNEAKSTLKTEIKRSPSSASFGLSRVDPTRTSTRSVKSAVVSSSTGANSGRGTSAARREASVSKQKEAELAMWKRRATYDPMKAAAEDRKKKEEAKKMAQGKGCERPSRSPHRRGEF